MPKRWIFHPRHENLAALAEGIGAGPLLTQTLVNRGLRTVEECRAFLNAGYADLHRPERLPGLERAAARLLQAISNNEKIAIYCDYDVDGVTSAALLYQCLELAGLRATVYVPHRIEEGYGLNLAAVQQLADEGHKLIVSVDCGVTSVAEAALAKELGVDLIITDHHEPGPALPDAYAIVNPKLPGSDYPFRHLAGVGVAFKLAWAICLGLSGGPQCKPHYQRFLTDAASLAALGTIADVVPLTGENRALATIGLKSLSNMRFHPGLQAIVESAKLADDKVKERDVAFIIGPRLNAAGRMGSARKVLRLLTEATPVEAAEIARELEGDNRRRQELEKEIVDQAVALVEARGGATGRYTLVLAKEGWHAGVIGIVASRLTERYTRPTILIAIEDGVGQGSGRSIPGFSLFDGVTACGSSLIRFGGHAAAVGLRIKAEKVEEFAANFETYARQHLQPKDLTPMIKLDGETTLAALTLPAVKELQRLAPFGQGNPQPIFAVTGCRLMAPPQRMGRDGAHLSMNVSQAGLTLRAICWRAGDQAETLRKAATIDLAVRPTINRFNGRESVELEVQDIHAGGYREPELVEIEKE